MKLKIPEKDAREINNLISGANRFYVFDEELLASLEFETKENDLIQTDQIQNTRFTSGLFLIWYYQD